MSSNRKIDFTRRTNGLADSSEPDTTKLARLIAAYAPHDGSFDLGIPDLHASRFSRTNKQCVHALQLPCLSIVAQGSKTVIVGDEVFEYDASRMLVYSVALPVAAQITRASQSEPYLSLRLDIDPRRIAELVLKVYPQGLPPLQERRAVYITQIDQSIVNASIRLMECLAQPGDAELLAPLVMDEILIRVLRSPIGVRVAQMGFAESSVNRIAKAISWLRANFSQPMKVEELAELVHMSVSSFPRALQVRDLDEPAALSKGAAPARGEASHVVNHDGRGQCQPTRGISQRLAVQPGIQPFLRECANAGRCPLAARHATLGLSFLTRPQLPPKDRSSPNSCRIWRLKQSMIRRWKGTIDESLLEYFQGTVYCPFAATRRIVNGVGRHRDR